MIYEFTKKCCCITPIGEKDKGYDLRCQTMIIAGMEWLSKHPEAKIMYAEAETECKCGKCGGEMFGVSLDTIMMQKAMANSVYGDFDIIMLKASTRHVLRAKEIGWNDYIKELEHRKQKIWN